MTSSTKTVNSSDMKKLIRYSLLILSVAAAPVFAVELDQAKNDGLIGERADGYLGVVDANADAAVVALVNDVNAKRKAEYQRIAAKNGLSLEQVQALATSGVIFTICRSVKQERRRAAH